MEIAVEQRLGYLERYKDTLNFKIMSYQRKLDESVPVSKLDEVNERYDELTQKYRQLLDRQDAYETKSENLALLEEQNKKFVSEIEFLRKELESEKEKVHVLEEALEKLKSYSDIAPSRKATETTRDQSAQLSLAKRLATIEMKELNERQRADHAQRT